eukprot:TRINITY_DN14891_c0_g1_i1.p1 TRINITY_DN14891_c0_g1~~TRINITY_DN14891_c0_g1_i1.p1  ORF type:complete len:450 (+),score=72.22 TRINITY_DN14891_c0_g1_i1:42-1391(+)
MANRQPPVAGRGRGQPPVTNQLTQNGRGRGVGVKGKGPQALINPTLNDFDVKNLLGKGAYGEVYLAQHKLSKKWMALKQMDKMLISMQGKSQHVKNEKQILLENKSEHMVHMYYSFQTPECLYLGMEYCPGGDLRNFLEVVGSLEEEESALYFAEMIMAVHDLHEFGYLHRDLKPDNFLIDSSGHLKLTDFGLSIKIKDEIPLDNGKPISITEKLSQDELTRRRNRLSLLPAEAESLRIDSSNISKRFTMRLHDASEFLNKEGTGPVERAWCRRPSILEKTGGRLQSVHTSTLSGMAKTSKREYRRNVAFSVVGSPAYMSPEVTQGLQGKETKGYREEVDWWSLGCVFWEIILGVPPLTGDSPEEIFEAITNWASIIPPLLEEYRVYMSAPCFNLLSGFLCDVQHRKGSDINYFRNHDFFKANNIDWNNLHGHTPHFVPQLPEIMHPSS